jgi:UDP-sulfoquinovose synthase
VKNTKQETILILGGDGYLGWTLGLAFANRTNKNVVLVDNMVKRRWEKEVDAKLLVPLKKPKARIAEYQRIFGKSNLSFEKVELLDPKAVVKVVQKYRPTVIINAAQQPSAPFSMMSAKNAAATFTNNINGHLNALWAIAEVDKSITYIKLGSAGSYMDTDTDYLPLGKKDFTFKHAGKEHQVLNSWLPMQATDFYHQSKISDFLLDDLCAKMWSLKVITVQQATIFGATIEENHAPENSMLSARFNYDAVFSTVMNRFVCQVAVGHPITIYGNGKQKTGLVSLRDTVENFMELAETTVKPGEHMVVHNYTHRLTIEEIAHKIAEAEPTAVLKYIKNPRKEPKGKLDKTIQVHSAIATRHKNKDARLLLDLADMIEFTKRYKDNIDTSIIMPKISWDVTETKANSEAARSRRMEWLYGLGEAVQPLPRKLGKRLNILGA